MIPYYYRILGVGTDATAAEIRRAYRLQARKLHPDVNPSPDAHEQFLLLQKAWYTLGDPDRKRTYDYMNLHYPHRSGQDPPYQQQSETYYQPPSQSRHRSASHRQRRNMHHRRTAPPKEEKEPKTIHWIFVGFVFVLFATLPFSVKLMGHVMFRFWQTEIEAEIVFVGDEIDFIFQVAPDPERHTIRKGFFRLEEQVVWKDGMPVQKGDRFVLSHLPWSHRVFRLHSDRPAVSTRFQYYDMIWHVWGDHPALDTLYTGELKGAFVYSLSDSVYHHFGVPGLAHLYFAFTHPNLNPYNNKTTFRQMTQTKRFKSFVDQISIMTMTP